MSRFGAAFRWHFRRERVRMVAFALVAALFVAFVVGISNSVRPSEVQEILDKLPDGLRAFLGLKAGEMFDMGRWVGVIHGHPVWLVAILGFPLAASLRGVAGGVDDGTLEVVMAQPISRTTYYAALASVVALGVTVVLTGSLLGGLAARAAVELPGPLATSTLLELTASGWALAMSVGGIALLVSVASAGGSRSTSIAVGLVVAMFFFRFLSDMVPGLSWLQNLSVFGYHDPRVLVAEGLGGAFFALLSASLVGAAAGLFAFRRKQLTF
jgi:ABC-2 type transport system permease protein